MTKQAFTVGRTSQYDKSLVKEPNPTKLGRTDDYGGGWIWLESSVAQNFIDSGQIAEQFPDYKDHGFSVYELELPTNREIDVTKEPDLDGVLRLLHDARIVRKVPKV
jgi:hypothetical protein